MFLVVDPLGKLLGEWSLNITIGSVILRIILAVVVGAIIGMERSTKRHSAGLRTFMLVSFASCTAMILDTYINQNGTSYYFISAACVIAIAIISSNTLLYTSKSQIKGLTTSVALWTSVVIGLLLGHGLYTLMIIAFIAQMISLAVFPKVEQYLKNRSNHFEVQLELKNASYLKDFVKTIRELGLKIDELESNPAYLNSGLSGYTVELSITSEDLKKYKTHKEIIEALRSLEYINYIEEM